MPEEKHGATTGLASERSIGDQVETMLGEFRVILPALAVLFGFQLTLAFSSGFADTPPWLRAINLAALLCTAIAIVFMLSPTSYHRLTQGLDESYGFLHMAQRDAGAGLAFLVVSLTLSIFVQVQQSFGITSISLTVAGGLFALMFLAWWVMPLWRAKRRGTHAPKWPPHRDPDLSESIGSKGKRIDKNG